MNTRDKFIQDNLKKAEALALTVWEIEFVTNVKNLIKRGIKLSQKQFNTLKDIADK